MVWSEPIKTRQTEAGAHGRPKRQRQHGWRGGWLRAVLMYLIMEVGLPDLALGHAHTTVPAHLALRYTLHHQPERATIA